MEYLEYERSRPGQMRAMLALHPIAYVPAGALEWHGEHAPLGLDGLKAHHLCREAAARTGGVVFPCVYWGAFDTMPFPFTFHFERPPLARLFRSTLVQLADWGFEVIVLLTGHYPPSQIKLLRAECRRFNRRMKKAGRPALAVGAPEMVFAVDLQYYGDHAGMWETSLMSAIAPELMDLDALPRGLDSVRRLVEQGIMGQDPAVKASAEKGKAAIDHIAANLAALVERLMEERDEAVIEEVYRRYDDSIKIVSPGIFRVIREALDVHSAGELLRYGYWSWRLPRARRVLNRRDRSGGRGQGEDKA